MNAAKRGARRSEEVPAPPGRVSSASASERADTPLRRSPAIHALASRMPAERTVPASGILTGFR